MPIAKLASQDIKLLSAAQVCTDPLAILKELVENSLDAGATSLSILLDGYGLDTLIVKDNGTGIALTDRDKLAHRHCTSKLTSLADLRQVATYGFRGEALASLAEVSGSLIMTTRTSTDAVATSYALNARGQVKPTKTSGDPVGTTVTATRLFSQLPVRREKLKKEAGKHVVRLQVLILTYALVHPSVRFQLTLKSGKKGEAPAVTVHHPVTSIEAAIARHFGTAAAQACLFQSAETSIGHITVVLPKLGQAHASLTNKPAILYVDSRPLTTQRGLGKKLLTLMHSHLAKVVVVSKPLIVLCLVSTQRDYDVNVEPSKNQIYFPEPDAVLATVKDLLETLYGTQSSSPSAAPNAPVRQRALEPDSIQPPLTESSRDEPSTELFIDSSEPLPARRKRKSSWMTTMADLDHVFDSEDEDDPAAARMTESQKPAAAHPAAQRREQEPVGLFAPDPDEEEEDFVPDRPALTSPWTIAALHAGPGKAGQAAQSTRPDARHSHSSVTPSSSPEAVTLPNPAKRRRIQDAPLSVTPATARRRPPRSDASQGSLLRFLKPQQTVSRIRDDFDMPDRTGQVSSTSPVRPSRTVLLPQAMTRASPSLRAIETDAFTGASPTKHPLSKSAEALKSPRRLPLERSAPDEQCHTLNRTLATSDFLAKMTQGNHDFGLADTSFDGISKSGSSLSDMSDLEELAPLGGNLALLTARSRFRVLALFVTPCKQLSDRLAAHKQSGFKEFVQMGDADQVVRIW